MLPRMLGADTEVACVDGRMLRYANLDYAASTPVMADVWAAVEAFVPWYSSVHRGSGVKSQVATAEFEGARDVVAALRRRARGRHRRLRAQHHRGDQRARRRRCRRARACSPAPPSTTPTCSPGGATTSACCPSRARPTSCSTATERALRAERIDLVAVTGASNVTGEVWPVAELARLAHEHGAELFVDAAQLAPHRAIDMARAGIDHLALSGHKLYAPFGAGALVGRLRDGAPLLAGGGAIKLVTVDDVTWAPAPDRFEAGSPNVIGVDRAGRRLPQPDGARHGHRRRPRALARRPPVDGARARPRPGAC